MQNYTFFSFENKLQSSYAITIILVCRNSSHHIQRLQILKRRKLNENITFWFCKNLKLIFIPKSVFKIEINIFHCCSDFTPVMYNGVLKSQNNSSVLSSHLSLM